jgi:aspartokinase
MIVMKFGGTSVADAAAIGNVVALVARAKVASGVLPIVVVSPMAGVTDALLALASAAEQRRDWQAGIEGLLQRHLDALHALAREPEGATSRASWWPRRTRCARCCAVWCRRRRPGAT